MESKSKGTGGSIIAALCILIYIFALVQGAFRVYLSIEQQKDFAKHEFTTAENIAKSAGANGFASDEFKSQINEALKNFKSIEALIITGPSGESAFEKKKDYAINYVNVNTPRFKNKFGLTTNDLVRPLPDIRNGNIKGIASIFDYNELLRILKDTLLIILIGFALSFLTMLLQLLLGKQEKPKGEMIAVPVPEGRQKEVKKAEKQIPGTGPKGLYSPRSNIGWEEYTKDRLDSELHRCSATEKDLALLLVEFSDINSDSMFKQAAEEAVNFFTSRDLLFENNNNGITVILPGIGFDIAISRAEKFYQRIIEKFPSGYGTSSSLCIGLSSRSGRLLNADRLLLEANEALKKARGDSRTSIIAFKSDPDKYRAFIASQN
ncbi:MAG: hypothetical protein FWD28_07570 [Treponema sp.]|nr:hypothetical protein [Treponema sp.]